MPIRTTILSGGEGSRFEGVANAAINPGHFVRRRSDGKLERQGTADVLIAPLIAIENEIFGKGTTDAYAANDNVLCLHLEGGAVVNARVAAAAPAIVIGDPISVAADGTVKKAASEGVAIATAEEAVDNSAGGAETMIRIRIK